MILLNMKIRLRSFGVSASFQHLPIALRYNLSAIIFYQLCLINVSQVLTVTTIPLQSFIFCHIIIATSNLASPLPFFLFKATFHNDGR